MRTVIEFLKIGDLIELCNYTMLFAETYPPMNGNGHIPGVFIYLGQKYWEHPLRGSIVDFYHFFWQGDRLFWTRDGKQAVMVKGKIDVQQDVNDSQLD